MNIVDPILYRCRQSPPPVAAPERTRFRFACCIFGARAEAHSFYSGGACAAARPQLSTSLTAYAAGAVGPNTAAAAACQSGSDKSIRVGLPSHH